MFRPGFPPMGARSSCTDSMTYRFRWPLSSSTRISILSQSIIGDPQPHDFGAWEARGVGRHQRCAKLLARHRREKSHHLFRAQDDGGLLLLADAPCRRAHGDTVKEASGRNRDIEAGRDVVGPNLRQLHPVRRLFEALSEFGDCT